MSDGKRLRLALLYGGRSAEHEISCVSARSVLPVLDAERYEVIPVALTRDGRWLRPARGPADLAPGPGGLPAVDDDGTPVALVGGAGGPALVPLDGRGAAQPIDVAFPLLHGPYGEDGTLQGALELAAVPYVGSGVRASAVGMDKALQKRLLEACGIRVARWLAIHETAWVRDEAAVLARAEDACGLPCFVKPANLGSSVGVSRCEDRAQIAQGIRDALRHDRTILVEEAIHGRELECAVLGNDEPQASVVGEIIPAGDFYDYEAKYLREGSRLEIPATLPGPVAEEIQRLAVATFSALGCSGMARVDVFYDEAVGRVVVNEANTIPGFTPISMYPKLWEASGISYPALVDRLIALALERERLRDGRPG